MPAMRPVGCVADAADEWTTDAMTQSTARRMESPRQDSLKPAGRRRISIRVIQKQVVRRAHSLPLAGSPVETLAVGEYAVNANVA